MKLHLGKTIYDLSSIRFENLKNNHTLDFSPSSLDCGKISDGYHTFDELYYHRMVLFATICNVYKDKSWKSFLHHDGTMYKDYFIVGIETPKGQFTYHYHKENWFLFDVKELKKAPEWDGHTSDDVCRLLSL